MVKILVCSLVFGCLICSCTSHQENITQPTLSEVTPDNTNIPITSDEQAMARALLFIKQNNLEWGQPLRLYRTVSNWYAVEFAGDNNIVLINPNNGHTELPMLKL